MSVIPTIYRESNLSKFSFIAENRQIYEQHVDELVEAIHQDNRLHLHPIIVQPISDKPGNFIVLDGQHRLLACRKLGTDIFYVVNERPTPRALIDDQISRSWRPVDYLNYYVSRHIPAYVEFKKIMEEHDLTFQQVFILLHVIKYKITKPFKSGELVISPKTRDFIHYISPYFKIVKNFYKSLTINRILQRRDFLTALNWFYKSQPLECFTILMNSFKSFICDFPQKASRETYEKMLISCYNQHKGNNRKRLIHPSDSRKRTE